MISRSLDSKVCKKFPRNWLPIVAFASILDFRILKFMDFKHIYQLNKKVDNRNSRLEIKFDFWETIAF